MGEGGGGGETQRETHTQTDRQTDRKTESQTKNERQKMRDGQRGGEKGTYNGRERNVTFTHRRFCPLKSCVDTQATLITEQERKRVNKTNRNSINAN